MKQNLKLITTVNMAGALAGILLAFSPALRADDVVLIASDAATTSSFDSGLNWSDGTAPAPGNTYQTAAFILRTPQNATALSFLGDSLEVQAGGTLRDKTAATITVANLILADNATVELTRPNNVNDATAAGALAGGITLNGTARFHAGLNNDAAGETLTVSSIIVGSGGITTAGSNGRIVLTGANSFSGGATLAGLANSTLQLGNADAVSNSTITVSLNNSLTFGSGIGTFNVGGLAGVSDFSLTDLAAAAVTLNIGGNNASSTFDGVMSGAGNLVKSGGGTLTLNSTNTYAGTTTVNAGTLVASSAAGVGSPGTVIVNDGATLAVSVSGANQVSISSLTLGGSTGATNKFFSLSSTVTAPVQIGTLTRNGASKISIASGNFVAGASYPLIQYTTLAGSGSLTLGSLPSGVDGNLSTVGNVIFLNVAAVSPSLWTGAVNNSWDIDATANWSVAGSSANYLDGAIVQFPDSGANPAVNILAPVAPASIMVSNASTAYSFSGSPIGGLSGLTKNGSGVLTLNNANTYSGSTVVSNGTVVLGTDSALPGGAGKGNVRVEATLDLNTHSQLINGLSGGGSVDTVAGGAPTLTLGGGDANSVFGGQIRNSAGTLALTKIGAGAVTLSGSNSYSGVTTIAGGALIIAGNNINAQTGFVLTNSGSTLHFATNYVSSAGLEMTLNAADTGETITVDPGAEAVLRGISGGVDAASTWFNGGGTLRLTNASTTYDGRLRLNNLHLIIDSGAVLTQTAANVQASQIGCGSVPDVPANSTGIMTVRGNGQFIQTAQGLRVGSDANGATGILNVQDQGSVAVPVLYIPRQSGNTGVVNQAGGIITVPSIQGGGGGTWQGTYNLNGGTLAWGGDFGGGPTAEGQEMFLNLNGGVFQSTGIATIGGWTAINVMSNGALVDMGSSGILLNDPLVAGDPFGGGLTVWGTGGLLSLTATNTYTGDTVISNTVTLSLSLPPGPVTSISNSPVIRVETGATLDVNGIASGYHVVSGQTLRGNGAVSGSVTVDAGGALTVGGATGTTGTLNFNFYDLTLNGNTVLRLDNSGTSDQLAGIGTLQAGGTLTLANVGPALANGNSFTLFGVSGSSGAFVISPLTPGPGLAWDQSQLSSGIISVVTAPAVPVISPELQDQMVECGTDATLIAPATGSQPLYFRWSTNGTPVGGWTTNNPNFFTLTNVHSAGSSYTVSVSVTNSVGSANSSATLSVQDMTPPVITLLGTNPMTILAQTPFVDPGATASDGCEGSVSVSTNSTVNTNALGTYEVTYYATDTFGNQSLAVRTVNIILNTGVWTNQAGGLWDMAANWLNGTVASGPASTADFNSIDLVNDITVSLNSPRAIAGLSFGDLTNSTAAGWTVDNNGNAANTLTLARFDGGSPDVTVNTLGSNKVVSIGAVLNAPNGLIKTSDGTLILSGGNTYANTITVAGGTLQLQGGSTNIDAAVSFTNANSTLHFVSNANYKVTGAIDFPVVTGNNGARVTVDSGAEVLFHGLSGGYNSSDNAWFTGGGILRMTNGNTIYDGRLRLNNLTLIIDKDAVLTQTGTSVASSQIGSGFAALGAPTGSTGILTVRANGQYIQTAQGLRIGSDANGATGILNVQDQGSVTVPLLYIPRQSGNTGIVNQDGGTLTTASIQGGGGGTWQGIYNLNGGTLAWGGGFGGGPTAAGQDMLLNLNGGVLQFTAAATVDGWTAVNVLSSGAVIDTAGNTVTFSQPLVAGDAFGGGLTKIGDGTLMLSGANSYSGDTVVNGGILEIAQPTLAANSKVTVTNNALLQLDFDVTNRIFALVLEGDSKPPGVYNSTTDPTHLAGLGSLQVASVVTNPTNITFTVSGNLLTLTWPVEYTGWHLQVQTNSLATGLGTDWVTIPNTDLSHSYTNTISPANGTVFYRMVYP